MFIGHYAVAPIGAATGKIKLWHGFIAVQLVDFAWAIFILLGIEKARIVPGFTEANPLDLHFVPYTHSLLFSFIWAIIGAVGFKILTKAKDWTGALIFGGLVLTHWIEDVIVHVPDMTFWPGSQKIGLGLWRNLAVSLPLELIIFTLGMVYYISKTKPVGLRSRFWIAVFMGVLILMQFYTHFGPIPGSINEVAISALLGFTLLAFLAARFERSRVLVVGHAP